MRTSIVGAAFLLAGAGAATVAAVDTTGSNLALNGSDTLFDVTNAVIASCPTQFSDFTTQGISYLGGGSGVGAGAMGLNTQQISPMSRALKNTEYCSIAAPASSTLAEGLLVGIDGVAMMTSRKSADQPGRIYGRAARYGRGPKPASADSGSPESGEPRSGPPEANAGWTVFTYLLAA